MTSRKRLYIRLLTVFATMVIALMIATFGSNANTMIATSSADGQFREVELTQGGIYLGAYNESSSGYVFVCTSQSTSSSIGSVYFSSGSTAEKAISIPKTGKYYLYFSKAKTAAAFDNYGIARTAPIDSSDYTLLGNGSSSTMNWVKIVVPSTRLVSLDLATDGYTPQFGIYNAQKKALSGGLASPLNSSTYTNHANFALKKGTYYVGIKTSSPVYGVKVKTTKIGTAKYGTTKKKARSLKKNTTYKGAIYTGNSGAQWYKIKVKKNQKVTLYMTSQTNRGAKSGGIKVTISGKSLKTGSQNMTYAKGTYKLYTTKKMKKNTTLYVKVQKSGTGSGRYTLKWK